MMHILLETMRCLLLQGILQVVAQLLKEMFLVSLQWEEQLLLVEEAGALAKALAVPHQLGASRRARPSRACLARLAWRPRAAEAHCCCHPPSRSPPSRRCTFPPRMTRGFLTLTSTRGRTPSRCWWTCRLSRRATCTSRDPARTRACVAGARRRTTREARAAPSSCAASGFTGPFRLRCKSPTSMRSDGARASWGMACSGCDTAPTRTRPPPPVRPVRRERRESSSLNVRTNENFTLHRHRANAHTYVTPTRVDRDPAASARASCHALTPRSRPARASPRWP